MSLFRTLTGQSQRSLKAQQSIQVQQDTQQTPSRPQPQSHQSKASLHKVLSNRSNADPYAGHLNHLTEHQENQLGKFKSTLYDQGLYRPGAAGQDPSHDDQTLLRYLRARKFDLRGALAQFADTEKWSQENKIRELYDQFDVEFYEKARRLYPQWTGHRDKRGIPVYVYEIKHLTSKTVHNYEKDAKAYKANLPFHKSLSTPAKMLPLFALYENLLRFTIPLCSSLEGRLNPEVPITNSNNIVDITGVGLKQFWDLKNHMQESSVLATAHYPETLDRIFIIGAPSFFPTVWGWIKRWFDPVTVNKIFILSQHEVKSRLSEYIDPDDFPKKYGGNLDWDFGMTPHLDEPAREAVEKNGSKGWIEGPCLWEEGQRVPVGTVGGKSRRPARVEPLPVVSPGAETKVTALSTTIETGNPISASLETETKVAEKNTSADPAQPIQASATPASTSAMPDAVPQAVPAAETPATLPPPTEPAPESTTQPPSMSNSNSTASTVVDTPAPETVNPPPPPPTNNDTAKVLDSSEAPIVANGEVLHPSHVVKPHMERFVTAAEDLPRMTQV